MNEDFTGTVMVGLDGPELTSTDRHRLAMPVVGAVCLFARNYTNTPELVTLVREIRRVAARPLVIATDHEGGTVQRFRGRGFSILPPARELGHDYAQDCHAALHTAIERGATIARQLALVDVDLACAPVLDIDYGTNDMLASRCFAATPQEVSALALAFCQGMIEQGMCTIGKHFPGHGWASADSHLEMPIDRRGSKRILATDGLPYRELIARNLLDGVMLSHVSYQCLAAGPATYAPVFVNDLLRGELGFRGKVLTDDLVMQAADIGDMDERVRRAAVAGCDLFLVVGGEPVLHDVALARLPASGKGASPWLAMTRGDRIKN